MAARNFTLVSHSATKGVVDVFFKVTFDGASQPTLGTGAGNVGVKSFVRTDTGDFTLVFGTPSQAADTYMALLGASVVFEGQSPDAPIMHVVSSSAIGTTGTLTLTFLDYAGSAADPGAGEIGYFRFALRNSTAI
jgi:hypothetical protein